MSNRCPRCGDATVIGEPCQNCRLTEFSALERAADRIDGEDGNK